MSRYLVRHNCEFTREIEADSEEEAIVLAGDPRDVNAEGWTEAWAPAEAEAENETEAEAE